MENNPKYNVLFWNSNSVLNKTHEIINLAQECNIDIIGLSETHLNPRHNLKLSGYKVHRSDRNGKGGGVAIAVKSSIKHFRQTIPPLEKIEAVAITLHTSFINVTIVSVYNPPKGRISTDDINKLLRLNKKVIIIGDLNAKHITWNCYANNRNGTTLLEYSTSKNFKILYPPEPTYQPSRNNARPSVLDLALTKGVDFVSSLTSRPCLPSDHNPVLFTIEKTNDQIPAKSVHNYNTANWKTFRLELDKNIITNPKITSTDDIDEHLAHISENIKTALNVAAPPTTMSHRIISLPDSIKAKIKIRNRLLRLFQTTRLQHFKTSVNRANTSIRKDISNWRNNNWSDFLIKLKPTETCTLWNATKIFRKKSTPIPPLSTTTGMALSDTEKANALADNFQSIHSQNSTLGSVSHTYLVQRDVRKYLSQPIETTDIALITPKELKDILLSRKNKKAPGQDSITNFVLKQLSNKSIVSLTILLNKMLMLSYFPESWKIAKVLAIHKPGKDSTLAKSYRPISLLSSLSKAFEKIILVRINQYITSNNIIINEQFGFRPNHSTTHQLVRLAEHITEKFNSKQHTGMVLLDIEKAFDTVWHHGLLYKLMHLRFPKYICHILHSYLVKRKFFVTINEARSSFRPITAGVPQGSLLGPVLFSLFINDLPRSPHTHLAIYADDTAIFSSSYRTDTIKNRLQDAYIKIHRFFKKWKIKLNDDKTTSILFTKRSPSRRPPIEINNVSINWSSNVKYLGVHLDSRLTYATHIKLKIQQAYAVMSSLYPMFNKSSRLSELNKLLIYKMIIRPIITYAAPVWSSASSTNIKTLQVIQNKCLRIAGNFPRYTRTSRIHNKFKVPSVYNFIHKLTCNFYIKSCNNSNILISSLGKYSLTKSYKHKRPMYIIM